MVRGLTGATTKEGSPPCSGKLGKVLIETEEEWTNCWTLAGEYAIWSATEIHWSMIAV